MPVFMAFGTEITITVNEVTIWIIYQQYKLHFLPVSLFCITMGVLMGLVVGTLPGLTSVMAVSLITPLTFKMDPVNGFGIFARRIQFRHFFRRDIGDCDQYAGDTCLHRNHL